MPLRRSTALAIILTIGFVLFVVGARDRLFQSEGDAMGTGVQQGSVQQQAPLATDTANVVQVGEDPVPTSTALPVQSYEEQQATSSWTDEDEANGYYEDDHGEDDHDGSDYEDEHEDDEDDD